MSDLDEITYRYMMGENIIYYRGKIAGGIYDNRLLVKPTKSAIAFMNYFWRNFYAANPAYGRIICRCETVSEGEILDALRRNPKAVDIDGVKRRTRSGMGRCQGGFCMPYVMRQG